METRRLLQWLINFNTSCHGHRWFPVETMLRLEQRNYFFELVELAHSSQRNGSTVASVSVVWCRRDGRYFCRRGLILSTRAICEARRLKTINDSENLQRLLCVRQFTLPLYDRSGTGALARAQVHVFILLQAEKSHSRIRSLGASKLRISSSGEPKSPSVRHKNGGFYHLLELRRLLGRGDEVRGRDIRRSQCRTNKSTIKITGAVDRFV